MKFTTVFVVLATVATAVSAMLSGNLNTNAKRFAYGLAPLPPHRRSPTPSYGAPKGKPSGINNSCNGGSALCCNSTTKGNDPAIQPLLGLLGIVLGNSNGLVGLTCSPLGVLNGGATCAQQTVCCENNSFNGIVALGCTPTNLNL